MPRAKLKCRLCNAELKPHEQAERVCDDCLRAHSVGGASR